MGIIDDGRYHWKEVYREIKWYIGESKKSSRAERYAALQMGYNFLYDTVHSKLAVDRTIGDNENSIREICRYTIQELLPLVISDLREIDAEIKKDRTENIELASEYDRYLELEDDVYALASFRSLTHFAHYMERQDDKSQWVWKYNMNDTMGGVFYYSNAMILDHKYQNLIKQCPTGYGKSKSDCVIIAFCFGYDINDDIMKIVGNRQLVKPITQAIVKMLKSKRFGKVFPEFGKYNGDNSMFKNCAETEGTFTLADSKKALSFACFNKETAIDGGRFNKQFYDDVTQSDDRENVNAHKKDKNRFDSQWKKRQYDEFSCLRWFTGTAYHREDFLSWIKQYYSNNRELEVEKSTIKMKWNKFVRVSNDKKTIYVSVPKLADLELGEDKCYCTFPQKYSKAEALKELHSSDSAIRRFMAMEQQTPLPPESLAFDWTYLKQYLELPQKIRDNDCETLLIIDPNRKGRDNYAGLIFKKPNDENDEHWYFVDCFYKKVSSKIAIPKICERASHHKVDRIAFEGNTVDTYQMKKNIKEEMTKFGWNEYTVHDFYSTLNKEDKISRYRDDIREKIIFPHRTMYSQDSDMGRALSDIVNYSFETKNLNDDSIDCCSMLIIVEEKNTCNTIQTLNIRL